MAKEMNITLYINSHSPFMIEALEVYSEKENLLECTHFYLSRQNEIHKELNDIKEINKDELEIIYQNLTYPYNTINDIRFENE